MILSSKEAKKLVGKKVKWIEHYDFNRSNGIQKQGIILEVLGRNVKIENDWKWLPDMYFLEEDKE